MQRWKKWALAAMLAASIAAGVAAPAAPLEGREVQIATGAAPAQPNVAVDPHEGFIVTWQERKDDGASLRYAVINANGVESRRGEIASGANWFVNWADFPSLVVLDNGDWVTYWLERSAGGPEAYDIRLVRSQDRGRSWSAPVTPHRDGTATQHGFVSLVPAGGDRVLAVWLDGRRAGMPAAGDKADSHEEHEGAMTLRSAIVDRAGTLSEEAELDESTCNCCQTDAARFAGRTVVVYRDRSAQEIRDISLTARNADGNWLLPRNLHADNWRIEGCPVNGPAIAVNRSRMLVAWTTGVTGDTAANYTIREWGRTGAALPLAAGARMRGRLDAAAWGPGYVISWIGSKGEAGATDSFSGLMLTQLGATGLVLAQRNVAEVPLSRISGNPRMATNGRQLLLVWSEPASEGKPARVAAQLLGAR